MNKEKRSKKIYLICNGTSTNDIINSFNNTNLNTITIKDKKTSFFGSLFSNKSNNNYINLRWASSSINQRNRTININNTSGVLGVSFNYKNNSWVSQWYDNTGDHKSKSFSIKKYGDDTKQITIDYRRLMEVLNNYTI